MRKSLLFMVLSLCLFGCESNDPVHFNTPSAQPSSNQTYSNMSMGDFNTILSFNAYGVDQEDGQSQFETVSTMFGQFNDLMDIYNDYEGINNIKTINDNAGIQPIVVDESIFEMLQLSKQLYELSDGEFDITMGAVFKIWHNYREEGLVLNGNDQLAPVPSQEELEAVSACRGWDHIILDETNTSVYIDDPCVSLDVGGIAKGFATEKIRELMSSTIDNGAIINAGGNTALVHQKPDGSPWRVGIADPDSSSDSILVLSLPADLSVVTSGDYERFYVGEDGNKYAHIIDPQTLYPPTYWRSVSIITSNGAIADGLSTILFTMDYQDGLNVLQKAKELFDLDFLEAVWLADDGEVIDSDHHIDLNNYDAYYTDGLVDALNQ